MSFACQFPSIEVIRMRNCVFDRIPANTRTPGLFGVTLVIESVICEAYMIITIVFLSFYVCVCVYFWTCIDDLALIIIIIARNDENIDQRISMKKEFMQFVELHVHLNR